MAKIPPDGEPPQLPADAPPTNPTPAEILAIGDGPPTISVGALLEAHWARVGRMSEPLPKTVKQVHALARWLVNQNGFFSCEHADFAADRELLFCSLLGVMFAQGITSWTPRAAELLANSTTEHVFQLLGILGVHAFGWPAVRTELERWYMEVRDRSDGPARSTAEERWKRFYNILADKRRGRHGPSPFAVHATFIGWLYRVGRARRLLRAREWPWPKPGALTDRVKLVAEAYGIERRLAHHVGLIDADGKPIRPLTETEVAHILTARSFKVSVQRVKNTLTERPLPRSYRK